MEHYTFTRVACFALPLIVLFVVATIDYRRKTYSLSSSAIVVCLFFIWTLVALSYAGILHTSVFSAGVYASVDLSGYKVAFQEDAGLIEFSRYFQVIRSDDKKCSIIYIDIDAHKCENFYTTRQEAKIYFHCSGDYAPDLVSYVDTEQRTLYTGYDRRLIKIDKLDFR